MEVLAPPSRNVKIVSENFAYQVYNNVLGSKSSLRRYSPPHEFSTHLFSRSHLDHLLDFSLYRSMLFPGDPWRERISEESLHQDATNGRNDRSHALRDNFDSASNFAPSKMFGLMLIDRHGC